MNEDLKQAVDSGTITEKQAGALELLQPGAYGQHKSWGFGKIAEWRMTTGQIVIDFEGKPGHVMRADYVADSVAPIPSSHIRVRLREELDAVRSEAANDPAGLARRILADLGGKATVAQILGEVTPVLFDAAKARKWWDSAKKKLKSDDHIQLPVGKSGLVEYLETPVATHVGLIEKFRGARHMKDQISAVDALMKSLDDFADEVEEMRVLALQIEEAASKGHRLQPAQALELLLARDEIAARHEALKPGESAAKVSQILAQSGSQLPELFARLPASKHRGALDSLEAAFGDAWTEKALILLQRGGARIVPDIVRLFEKNGKAEMLRERIARSIIERSASSDLLFWLCKERCGPFETLFDHTLFGAALSAIELDQLSEQKKSMRLRDLLSDDKTLLEDFFDGVDTNVVRDAMRRLLLTTAFSDLDKRSLLGRLIKKYPELQSMVSGEAGEEAGESLTVSWASLERRKAEFDDLVNRLIPQNVRDIQTARSYGDLRENFEFKSAKEQQAVLGRRKAELEHALSNARGTNFENPDTSSVSIGTTVRLVDIAAGTTETYSILGAWDSSPHLGIISYKAAIGQALLGVKPGAEVTLTDGRRVRVESIEPFKNLELLGSIAESPTEPAGKE